MTKKDLLQTHADYDSFLPEWRFFVRSYFGGMRYSEGNYLVQHPFESSSNYERRKDIAYYYNYCQPIVDIFVSLLFKKEPTRDFGLLTKDPLFVQFQADADLTGNTLSQFVREAQRFAAVYGRISVIVDKPAVSVLTQAQARDEGIRPYLTMITPENILNWRYVRLRNGRSVLDMVTVVEDRDKDGKPSSIRIWDRQGWQFYVIDEKTKDGDALTPVDSGFHDLGVVPLVNIYNKNSVTRMVGLSDIEDIAGINKNIYYLCSDAQEIIENTAFPMLAMPYDKSGPEQKETGPKNIMEFDPDAANAKPYWLEAPHSSLNEIREYVSQHRRNMFQMANLLGIYISGESVQPPAGIALEIENQQRDAVLAEKADNIEQAELQILTMYALWEGKKFDGSVKYQRDFSIRDLDMNTQNIINLLQSNTVESEEFWQQLQKKAARNLLGDLSKADRNKVYQDIEQSKKPVNTPPANNPGPAGGVNNNGGKGV